MQDPPRRSSAGPMLLAAVAVVGSAFGALYYQAQQRRAPAPLPAEGFDLAEVEQKASEPAGNPGASAAAPAASSLGMIKGAPPGMRVGSGPRGGSAAQRAGASLQDIVRRTEAVIGALARSYTKRYPTIAQYGRDWMKYPDLRRLNDDYMRRRDPIAFIRGVAASPNFPKLMRKYAGEKPVRDFVMESVRTAPPDAIGAVSDYLNTDRGAKELADSVTRSMGLPAGLIPGGGSKIDGDRVMQSALGTSPELQQAAKP